MNNRNTETKKIGRPKLPPGQARGVLAVRLSPIEKQAIESKAKRAGKPLTQWAREILLGVAS